MREQASLLGTKTRNVVEAEVETRTFPDDRMFCHNFVLVAPALGNYRYTLFQARHGMELYPVEFNFEGEQRTAKDEERFVELLRSILANERTLRVIDALLSQSVS